MSSQNKIKNNNNISLTLNEQQKMIKYVRRTEYLNSINEANKANNANKQKSKSEYSNTEGNIAQDWKSSTLPEFSLHFNMNLLTEESKVSNNKDKITFKKTSKQLFNRHPIKLTKISDRKNSRNSLNGINPVTVSNSNKTYIENKKKLNQFNLLYKDNNAIIHNTTFNNTNTISTQTHNSHLHEYIPTRAKIKSLKLNKYVTVTVSDFVDEIDQYLDYLRSIKTNDLIREKAITMLKKTNSEDKNSPNNKKSSNNKVSTKTNKFFQKVLDNVIRRVAFIDDKNTELTEDFVINLIKEESEQVSQNLDQMMESFCKIKNFSTRLQDKDSTYILPLINSVPIHKKQVESESNSNYYIDIIRKFYNIFELNPPHTNYDFNPDSAYYKTEALIKAKIGKAQSLLRSVLSPINEKDKDYSFNDTDSDKIEYDYYKDRRNVEYVNTLNINSVGKNNPKKSYKYVNRQKTMLIDENSYRNNNNNNNNEVTEREYQITTDFTDGTNEKDKDKDKDNDENKDKDKDNEENEFKEKDHKDYIDIKENETDDLNNNNNDNNNNNNDNDNNIDQNNIYQNNIDQNNIDPNNISKNSSAKEIPHNDSYNSNDYNNNFSLDNNVNSFSTNQNISFDQTADKENLDYFDYWADEIITEDEDKNFDFKYHFDLFKKRDDKEKEKENITTNKGNRKEVIDTNTDDQNIEDNNVLDDSNNNDGKINLNLLNNLNDEYVKNKMKDEADNLAAITKAKNKVDMTKKVFSRSLLNEKVSKMKPKNLIGMIKLTKNAKDEENKQNRQKNKNERKDNTSTNNKDNNTLLTNKKLLKNNKTKNNENKSSNNNNNNNNNLLSLGGNKIDFKLKKNPVVRNNTISKENEELSKSNQLNINEDLALHIKAGRNKDNDNDKDTLTLNHSNNSIINNTDTITDGNRNSLLNFQSKNNTFNTIERDKEIYKKKSIYKRTSYNNVLNNNTTTEQLKNKQQTREKKSPANNKKKISSDKLSYSSNLIREIEENNSLSNSSSNSLEYKPTNTLMDSIQSRKRIISIEEETSSADNSHTEDEELNLNNASKRGTVSSKNVRASLKKKPVNLRSSVELTNKIIGENVDTITSEDSNNKSSSTARRRSSFLKSETVKERKHGQGDYLKIIEERNKLKKEAEKNTRENNLNQRERRMSMAGDMFTGESSSFPHKYGGGGHAFSKQRRNQKESNQEELQKNAEKMKNMFKGLDNMDSLMNVDGKHFNQKFLDKRISSVKLMDFDFDKDISNENKARFKELIEQMENAKNFNVDSYVGNIEKNFREIQDEIDMISSVRKAEERMNNFMNNFQDSRMKMLKYKDFMNSLIKVKDTRVTMKMSSVMKMGPIMNTE